MTIVNKVWNKPQREGNVRLSSIPTLRESLTSDCDIDAQLECTVTYTYAFTVTPKGKNKKHKDYVLAFLNDLRQCRACKWMYFAKEYTCTAHLHGVIATTVCDYKFAKLKKSTLYTFTPEWLRSINWWGVYITKDEECHKKRYWYRYQIHDQLRFIGHNNHELKIGNTLQRFKNKRETVTKIK